MRSALGIPRVDCVVLTRDENPLHPRVAAGIAAQRRVQAIIHRVVGRRLSSDADRLQAIVRARNEGKRRGTAPWLMFLDDDVVLGPDCVRMLLDGLRARPLFAALGADYLRESRGCGSTPHVAMGATLFRRGALDQIQFRTSDTHCECLCCCTDLRRRRWGIGYLQGAQATHISIGHRANDFDSRREPTIPSIACRSYASAPKREGFVLAAFDRRHVGKFQHRFLTSFRNAGNREPVLALAYGLHSTERRELRRLRGVETIHLPANGVAVPIRRLLDFQRPVEQLPSDTPVAYWDAGDVIFQDLLTELWLLVTENENRLLVVAEHLAHPQNRAVAEWTLSVSNADERKRCFDLLSPRPFLNGGFGAGNAATMLKYLRAAHELRHTTLRGTTDWGDQTAMNVYCYSDRERSLTIDDRWNYCLYGRRPGEVRLGASGRFIRRDGGPVSVVHGNGRSLRSYAILAPHAMSRLCRSRRLVI